MLTRLALVFLVIGAPFVCARGDAPPGSDPDMAAIVKLEKAGQYAQAMPLAEQLLARREKQHGPKSADVAEALIKLGDLHYALGQYPQARDLEQRALGIREVVFGRDSMEVAEALNGIAIMCRRLGEFERARPLYERALRIQQAKLGPMDPQLAQTLNNMGVFYRMLGEYDRARPLYERALAIWEKALGPKDPLVATALHNLAAVYRTLNEPELALRFVERSRMIREEVLGTQHPDVAASLNLEAGIYEDLAEYAKAETLYVQTLKLRERIYPPNHPETAVSVNNLGYFYLKRGKVDLAGPQLRRSLKMRRELMGDNNPSTALALLNWGLYLVANQRYEEGRGSLRQALRIEEAAFGSVNPDVSRIYSRLAESYAAQHRTEAIPLFERGLAITESVLRRDLLGADETRLEAFFNIQERGNEERYSLVLQFPGNQRAQRLALATALLHKGRVSVEAKLLARTIRASLKAPEDQERLMHLVDVRRRIAGLELKAITLTGKGPADAENALHQSEVEGEKLQTEAEALEDQLAQRSAPLRKQRQLPEPAEVIAAVAEQLPPKTALVELILFHPTRFDDPPDAPSSAHDHYLALVLDGKGDVRSSDLGEAAPIDRAVAALHEALSKPGGAPGATHPLGRLLMSKLGPLLHGATELYLSPDGELNLVPFAALDDGKGVLLDRYRMTYLTSGLDLLPDPKPTATAVVVVADPDFHSDGAPLKVSTRGADSDSEPASDASTAEPDAETESASSFDDGARGSRWHRLLGTRREAEEIRQLLPQASLLLGADATKTALLRLAAPGILHIATHGLFLDDPVATATAAGAAGAAPPPRVPRNPLLRSAMVLAGANGGGQRPGTEDNGLVTALEIAEMDLSGTQLVVLSACDTGRGQVKRGQGVYGLRRAFRIAGAETLVMSLWKVDDETTRNLMVRYYQKLIAGEGRTEAMRQTMKEIRAQHPDPNYWAPFFVLGHAEPLRGIQAAAR